MLLKYIYAYTIKHRAVQKAILATHLLNQSCWFIISCSLFHHSSPGFCSRRGPLCNNRPLWGWKIDLELAFPRTPFSPCPKSIVPLPSMLRHVKLWRHVCIWSIPPLLRVTCIFFHVLAPILAVFSFCSSKITGYKSKIQSLKPSISEIRRKITQFHTLILISDPVLFPPEFLNDLDNL